MAVGNSSILLIKWFVFLRFFCCCFLLTCTCQSIVTSEAVTKPKIFRSGKFSFCSQTVFLFNILRFLFWRAAALIGSAAAIFDSLVVHRPFFYFLFLLPFQHSGPIHFLDSTSFPSYIYIFSTIKTRRVRIREMSRTRFFSPLFYILHLRPLFVALHFFIYFTPMTIADLIGYISFGRSVFIWSKVAYGQQDPCFVCVCVGAKYCFSIEGGI